jgi:transposase
VWRKHRWRCPTCGRTWTEQQPGIASARCALTTRAARWATMQVGRHGRSVQEVADDLGCDLHTVMDAVALYGTPLIDDPDRFGTVTALGLDETLFCREGRFRIQCWSTQIVDVRRGQLLDVVPGRDSSEPCRWLAERSDEWRVRIEWATLDLSASYRAVFDTMLPDAVQVADPMLLLLSSVGGGVLGEDLVEVACDVALEASDGFSACLAFADPAVDVGACRWVPAKPDEDDSP